MSNKKPIEYIHDMNNRIKEEFEKKIYGTDLFVPYEQKKHQMLFTVTTPKSRDHGHFSSNSVMQISTASGLPVNEIFTMVMPVFDEIKRDGVIQEINSAGPGFINSRLNERAFHGELRDALKSGVDWGNSSIGNGQRVNVEYVSANPTGPMHVGHGRGAVFGDALAALLEKAGFAVTREYYINDAGAQVDLLARSAHLRYREALGETIGEIPAGLYPGDYLKDTGAALAARDGRRWLDAPETEWLPVVRSFAIDAMMDLIREDLAELGVRHAIFSSERALVAAGAVERCLDFLAERDLVYTGVLEPPKGKTPEDWEPRPQTLFRATRFGDDVDRPLRKSDGSWTYFAADLAYHLDKHRRGFADMIDVWGADHGGYVKRMVAGVRALTEQKGALDVKLCQLVRLTERGEPVKMSKRAGTFVTLRDVIDRVGKDVVRFIMLTRRNDQTLDFDFAKVMEKSRENPVFYVQYAHARAHSVLRNARRELPRLDISPTALADADFTLLREEAEQQLMERIADWRRLVEDAAKAHDPHRIAFFLYQFASEFHGLWNLGNDKPDLRFLLPEQPELTRARLALVSGVATVIASGLKVMGVEPLEEMR